MRLPNAIIRRRMVRLLEKANLPRLESSDFLYIGLSLVIGFGIGARTVVTSAQASVTPVQAAAGEQSVKPPGLSLKQVDARVVKLAAFLESKGSPLAKHAELIIKEADRYDIGWTKVAAIAGMESAFGTNCPAGSHNAWGLGGPGFMRFGSWEKSIHYVSALLGGTYKDLEYKAIKERYCPSSDNCNPKWSGIVGDLSDSILSAAF